jgi:predicted component of type VI protein secretion system
MRVTIESGPDRGASADVATGVLTIGRHESSDLVLTDQQASSRHAAIEVAEDGSFSLRDLGSTNGTLVDGKPVEGTVALTGNERVGIGESVLQLSVEPDARTVVRPVVTSDTVIKQVPPARALLRLRSEALLPCRQPLRQAEADGSSTRRSWPRLAVWCCWPSWRWSSSSCCRAAVPSSPRSS